MTNVHAPFISDCPSKFTTVHGHFDNLQSLHPTYSGLNTLCAKCSINQTSDDFVLLLYFPPKRAKHHRTVNSVVAVP